MDYAHSHGGARAPLPNLSSGQTYFTVESLQGLTTLPRLPSSSAFAPLPFQRGPGANMPSTHDVSFPASSIHTLDPRETLRGSIRDPYRQPITDGGPTMGMDYLTEPFRNPIGGLQILNQAVAPADLAHQYHQRELHRISPGPGFNRHRSRPQQVFKSMSTKTSDRGLQQKFSQTEQERGIPGAKDNSRVPKMPGRPGWCSLCDVDCNTKEVLYRHHVFGKKHQSMLEELKEGVSRDGKNPQIEQPQQLKNPQIEQPQQLMGWCSLCEVECGTMENLHKQHTSGKKHQQMLGIGKGPQNENVIILGKRKQPMMEERNTSSKKRQKLSDKRHTAQLRKPGNYEVHLEVDGESKKCADGDGCEAKNSKLLISTQDDAEAGGEDQETVLGVKEVDLGATSEKDNSKQSSEVIEVDGKKENVPGGKVEEAEVDGKKENVPGGKVEEAEVDGRKENVPGGKVEEAEVDGRKENVPGGKVEEAEVYGKQENVPGGKVEEAAVSV